MKFSNQIPYISPISSMRVVYPTHLILLYVIVPIAPLVVGAR
jgi:hypothetical protein